MGDARLLSDGPEWVPERSKLRKTVLNGCHVINLANNLDIILHDRSETGTGDSRTPGTLVEHWSQVEFLKTVRNSISEHAKKTNSGLMQLDEVIEGDVINHVPWVLLFVSKGSEII